jgi:hypothetical protein
VEGRKGKREKREVELGVKKRGEESSVCARERGVVVQRHIQPAFFSSSFNGTVNSV